MNVTKNPCTQDCPNRTVTCKFDGTCTKYQEYRKARDEFAAIKQKTKDIQVDLNDYRIRTHTKFVKKQKRTSHPRRGK